MLLKDPRENGRAIGRRVRDSVPVRDRDDGYDLRAGCAVARARGLNGPERTQFLSGYLDGLYKEV